MTSTGTVASSPPPPTEELDETQQLQRRLRRFAWAVAALTLIATPINIIITHYVETSVERQPGNPLLITTLIITTMLLSVLVAWQLGARRWTRGALATLDSVAVLVAALVASLTIATGAKRVDEIYTSVAVLGFLLLGRGLFVPSSARRTLYLSIGAMTPVVAALVWVAMTAPRASMATAAFLSNTLILCATPVFFATVSSRILTNLRDQVATARRLGQYTLLDKIGEGGMGSVYRAQHALLRRPTAIKLLRADRGGEDAIRLFEHEVQITAGLTDPHVVAIFDYGRSADGIFYYAMEYLDGVDLERLVREFGPQPAGRVVAILRQVCDALAEAHANKLIHRDIKPANIVLCERGLVGDVAKVLDFGLVHRIDAEVSGIAGTPGYLSPEAIDEPSKVGPASDLYAVGAVAYFLLTGTTVFEAKTFVELCDDHLHTTPMPPSQRTDRAIPRELEALVLACLAKDPAGRPESAIELRVALDALESSWSADEATRWWAAFRTRSTPKPDAIDAVAQTVAVAAR